ncbi:MAG TPA: pyridoxamine 5'-phosphate oxidase, partial [Polyangiaceae bacterium]|nr:pyridoxamine 5'-phosphate oxidase [Polyangiaceae bacterium]
AVRFVLVKIVDARGFTFFTNYESVKARELEATPRAALAFHWASTGEQFRVRGAVQRIPVEESDAYFATRPRESQLGAWASQQSAPIADRAALDAQLDAVTQRFAGHAQIPRPAHWGGYRIAPSVIEVWRDRSGRLHDRWSFARANDGAWSCQRLQP